MPSQLPAQSTSQAASSLQIESFEIGPFPNNLYLLRDEAAREFVVVDPSIESEAALARGQELVAGGYTLRAIWYTHGLVDHVHDYAMWKAAFAAPVAMHEADDFLLEHLHEQSIWLGLPRARPVAVDLRFHDGQSVHVGGHAAGVLHLPGHSPGSVAFYFADANVVISGDVLFRGSIGRTDLPGCDNAQMQNSLHRIAALPAATRVLSGHGEETTIAAELQSNPFLRNLKTTN
jgi:glyoxylase-like metal-dependent hydrolase (beta-lactamase superfamily II)